MRIGVQSIYTGLISVRTAWLWAAEIEPATLSSVGSWLYQLRHCSIIQNNIIMWCRLMYYVNDLTYIYISSCSWYYLKVQLSTYAYRDKINEGVQNRLYFCLIKLVRSPPYCCCALLVDPALINYGKNSGKYI